MTTTTQPQPKLTAAQRTLAEFRNDRKLAAIIAARLAAKVA